MKIQVSVASAANLYTNKLICKLFFNILEDYQARFNVTVCDPKPVSIALVDCVSGALGRCYNSTDAVLIQVEDPFLTRDITKYPVIGELQFYQTICHEMVHACQYLTGRKGMIVKGFNEVIPEDQSYEERYLHDPLEVEARVLDFFYFNKFARDLLDD